MTRALFGLLLFGGVASGERVKTPNAVATVGATNRVVEVLLEGHDTWTRRSK